MLSTKNYISVTKMPKKKTPSLKRLIDPLGKKSVY